MLQFLEAADRTESSLNLSKGEAWYKNRPRTIANAILSVQQSVEEGAVDASVVGAMLALFSMAALVTLAGSMMPRLTRSQ